MIKFIFVILISLVISQPHPQVKRDLETKFNLPQWRTTTFYVEDKPSPSPTTSPKIVFTDERSEPKDMPKLTKINSSISSRVEEIQLLTILASVAMSGCALLWYMLRDQIRKAMMTVVAGVIVICVIVSMVWGACMIFLPYVVVPDLVILPPRSMRVSESSSINMSTYLNWILGIILTAVLIYMQRTKILGSQPIISGRGSERENEAANVNQSDPQ